MRAGDELAETPWRIARLDRIELRVGPHEADASRFEQSDGVLVAGHRVQTFTGHCDHTGAKVPRPPRLSFSSLGASRQ